MRIARVWLHILCKIIIGGLTFMKLVKQLFFIAMLLGSVAVVLTSCDDGGFGGSSGGGSSGGGSGTFGGSGGGGSSGGGSSGGGGGSSGGGGSGFVMDEAQLAHYTGFITGLELSAAAIDIDSVTVTATLATGNIGAMPLGYKIEDKQAGRPISQGTKSAALKKRFIPKKL